jgi:hypothetical protein
MPTIANKILHPSSKHILLYKEGVFWVAYEQSAYYIAQYKGYKPTKKYFKNINQTIVSVGFPNIDALLNEIEQNNSIQSIKKTDTTIEILLQKSVTTTDVELWKENILQKNQEKPTSKASIEQLVKAFPLANKTPMEAFLFIKELQDS